MDGAVEQLEALGATAEGNSARGDSRAADDAAFALLVDRHAVLLYRVALSLLRNPQDAEDAVQETLLKLYRTGGWRGMQDERSFLAKSVWRVGLTRLGSSGAKAMRYSQDVADLALPSEEISPEQSILDEDNRRVMRDLIGTLPEEFRQALVLSAIEGMRSHEVATVLGVAEATVRTRVMRAKAEMRRRFLERYASAKEARR